MKSALLPILLLLTIAPASAPAKPTVSGCERHPPLPDQTPLQSGPLRLRHVFCWGGAVGWLPAETPTVSPDGAAATTWSKQTGFTIHRDGAAPLHLPIRRSHAVLSHDPSARWSEASDGFWTSSQARVGGISWALGPMRPLFVTLEGETRPLPALEHPAGPLDDLLWIDGGGLALAQFGTRGGSYRPEHPDPAPTFAFVDARRGSILDTLPFAEIGWTERSVVRQVAAVRLPGGRARALVVMHQTWAVWTQGRRPRVLPNPYVGEQGLATLSPGGDRVIVSRPLPGPMRCIRTEGCSGPVTRGVSQAMHDLDTGALLWTLEGEGVGAAWGARPAFSPDGRHVLAELQRADGGADLVLIDAASGKVKQRLLVQPPGNRVLGFTATGEAWVLTPQTVTLYAFAGS